MDLKAKRVAVYARYSSDRQNPSSIEDQLRVCREYVVRAGGEIGDGLVFMDAAISGTSAVRPGFQALHAAVRAGSVDVVVTEDLSRIGRDVGNNDRTLKEFKSLGARLIAINDGLDTGQSSAKLIGAIKSAMSEAYLDELKGRTKRGLDGAFDAGAHTGGRAFGYRIVPMGDGTERKRLEVDPVEAAIVRRIFADFVAGHTQLAITTALNREGIKSPRGQRWSHMSVRALLHNELYAGLQIFNRREWSRDNQTGKRSNKKRDRSEWRRRERPELRIVDAATWHAAQEKSVRAGKAWKSGERTRPGYPLSGLLACAECGELMVLSGGPRKYYQCGGRRRGFGCHNASALRERDVRTWLLERVIETAGASDVVEDLRSQYAATVGGKDRAIKAELGQRRAQLAVTVSKTSKLFDYVLEHGETPATRAKMAELEDHAELQRAAISKLEAELGRVPVIPSAEMIRAFLRALPDAAMRKPIEMRALLGEMLARPARCSPTPAGYRVSFELQLSAILNATSAAPGSGPRSFVAVAGAGFAYDRALDSRVIEGVIPRGHGGER